MEQKELEKIKNILKMVYGLESEVRPLIVLKKNPERKDFDKATNAALTMMKNKYPGLDIKVED